MMKKIDQGELSEEDEQFNEKISKLESENAITKLERTIAENKKATILAEKDRLEASGFLKEVERRINQINEWTNNQETLEKARGEAYDKMVQELKSKQVKIDKLIEALLGFIVLGKVSQYRDLNERISNDNLAILELLVQEIKKERQGLNP
jgi:hypothetical protein